MLERIIETAFRNRALVAVAVVREGMRLLAAAVPVLEVHTRQL